MQRLLTPRRALHQAHQPPLPAATARIQTPPRNQTPPLLRTRTVLPAPRTRARSRVQQLRPAPPPPAPRTGRLLPRPALTRRLHRQRPVRPQLISRTATPAKVAP